MHTFEEETENRYSRFPFQNVSVEVFVLRMMEVLKEFLESSTIHGLFYISTAKVSPLSIPHIQNWQENNGLGFDKMV